MQVYSNYMYIFGNIEHIKSERETHLKHCKFKLTTLGFLYRVNILKICAKIIIAISTEETSKNAYYCN